MYKFIYFFVTFIIKIRKRFHPPPKKKPSRDVASRNENKYLP